MSFSRRLLKINAKKSVRQNYWRYIAVSFLVTLICGTGFTSTGLLWHSPVDEMGQLVQDIAKSVALVEGMRSILDAVMNWFFRTDTLVGIIGFVASVIIWVLFKIFIANIVKVNALRFYLESRTYPKTRVKKLVYLFKGKDIRNPAKIMLCMYVYRFLWWFTIVGGVIKTYEYSMIPYILAENPDISKKEAFQLSRQLMQGKKFGLFVLQISFLPWFMLGLLTMGLTNIFFLDAYLAATEAEFYMMLRRDVVAQRNRYSRLFIDKYLENKPTEDEILINMFVLEKDYMPNLESDEFALNVYPMFLRGKDSKWYEPPYTKEDNRDYHITTFVLLFYLTSVVGWVIDATVGFLQQGRMLSGGLLYGPWIPLVGVESVLIMLIGRRLMKHPLINVSFITVFASGIHYLLGWAVEEVKGIRYWDFTGYFLNLNGRICLASVLVVGTLGAGLFYLVGPELDEYLSQYPVRKKWRMCILLFVLSLVDIGCSIYAWFFC